MLSRNASVNLILHLPVSHPEPQSSLKFVPRGFPQSADLLDARDETRLFVESLDSRSRLMLFLIDLFYRRQKLT